LKLKPDPIKAKISSTKLDSYFKTSNVPVFITVVGHNIIKISHPKITNETFKLREQQQLQELINIFSQQNNTAAITTMIENIKQLKIQTSPHSPKSSLIHIENEEFHFQHESLKLMRNSKLMPLKHQYEFSNLPHNSRIATLSLNSTSLNTIIQDNGKTRLYNLQDLCISHNILVFAGQESQITQAEFEQSRRHHRLFNENYVSMLQSFEPDKGIRGLYLAIHKDLQPVQQDRLSTKHTLAATFRYQKIRFLYINIYLNPSDKINAVKEVQKMLEDNLEDYQDCQIIVAGDFNQRTNILKSLIFSKLQPTIFQTTTGHNPITFSNQIDPKDKKHKKRATKSATDHVWHNDLPHVKISTKIQRYFKHIKTQHYPLFTNIDLNPECFKPTPIVSVKNQMPPTLDEFEEREKKLIHCLKAIEPVTKRIEFRRKLLLNARSIARSEIWDDLYPKLYQIYMNVRDKKDEEKNANEATYLCTKALYDVMNGYIDPVPRLPRRQEQLKKSYTIWNKWSFYLTSMNNDKKLRFDGLSPHWSRVLAGIMKKQQYLEYQTTLLQRNKKKMESELKFISILQHDGKLKESQGRLDKLINSCTGKFDEPTQRQVKLVVGSGATKQTVTEKKEIATEYWKYLKSNAEKFIKEHEKRKKLIRQMEERGEPQTEILKLKPDPIKAKISSTKLDSYFKTSMIRQGICDITRNVVNGSDGLPGEILFGCVVVNYTESTEKTPRETVVKNLMNKKHFNDSRLINYQQFRPKQLGQRFRSTKKAAPNMMLECITILCNIIHETSITPRLWKISHVSMLPKQARANRVELFRPVSIGATLQKVINKVYCIRLLENCRKYGLLSSNQTAYQKEKERFENVLMIIQLAHDRMMRGTKLWTLFLDISKAFDSINHEFLYEVLEAKLPNSPKFIKYVRNMYSNLWFTVKHSNHFSPLAKQNTGIKQGCIISPILFLLFFNEITSAVPNNALSFADDVTLVAELRAQLDVYARRINTKAEQYQMMINEEKSNLVVFGVDETERANTNLTVNGKLITAQGEVKYLGVHLHDRLNVDKMIKTHNGAVEKYKKVLYNNNIPMPIKQHIINQQIYSRVFTNAPVIGALYGIGKNDEIIEKKIIQPMDELIKLTTNQNIHKSVPSVIHYSMVQVTPPKQFIFAQTLRFLHKFANGDLNEKLKNLIRQEPGPIKEYKDVKWGLCGPIIFKNGQSSNIFTTFMSRIRGIGAAYQLNPHTGSSSLVDVTKIMMLPSSEKSTKEANDERLKQAKLNLHKYPKMYNVFQFKPTDKPISVVTETVKMAMTIEQIFRMTTLDRDYFHDRSRKAINLQIRNTTLFRHYLKYYKPENMKLVKMMTGLYPQYRKGWENITLAYVTPITSKSIREPNKMCTFCKTKHHLLHHLGQQSCGALLMGIST
jgi:hypothetical protein